MALNQPEQSPDDGKSLSSLVNEMLLQKGWTQSDLARKSCLSKATVSRIVRDSNDKGETYRPKADVVMAISLAFELDRAGWERLHLAAFPEQRYWFIALDKHQNIFELNEQLHDHKLPLVGDQTED